MARKPRILPVAAVVAALASLGAGAAHAAASIGVGPLATYVYSKEGLELTGSGAVALPDIILRFGNNLTYQDDLYLTVAGVIPLAATPSPTLVTCTPGTSAVGYVGTVANGWQFRVTSVTGVNLGDTCTFSGLEVQGASMAHGGLELGYFATRFLTGTLVDAAQNPDGLEVRSQYGITPRHALDGRIDVDKDRLAFTVPETEAPGDGASEPDQADTLNFDTTVTGDQASFTGPTVITAGQLVTIKGDLSWVDSDGDGSCESGEYESAIKQTGSYPGWNLTSWSDCRSFGLKGPLSDTEARGFFFVPGNRVLSPQEWEGLITWTYVLGSTPATGSTQAEWPPGVWTINGSQVYIDYLPYGPGIGRIVYAANRGAIDATVTADVYFDGRKHVCPLGPVPPAAVTQLSALLDDCVINTVGVSGAGKVAVLLTFTAPDKDIEVYSAYNVGSGDRGTVVNTSNGRTYFYGSGKTYPDLAKDVANAVTLPPE